MEDIQTGKVSRKFRYFKMNVLKSHESEEINELVQNQLDQKSIVYSDKSTSYLDIAKYVDIHVSGISTKETTSKILPWVLIVIVM